MRFIFDLDGTVIDSTHRQGDTLDDWRRLNTARNVALDSPLPLLDQMRDAIADDLDVIVCTSRVMSGRGPKSTAQSFHVWSTSCR